ncbi:MAG TPA: hypothetical protein VFS98_11265 [Methylomirabilota bacterium]|nr:hypothetical protein [Methylomirabilota bacterium]
MADPLMVGAVLYADEETILLTDGTSFVAPAWMHLPAFHPSTTLVIEYEILEGRNVLIRVPEPRQ